MVTKTKIDCIFYLVDNYLYTYIIRNKKLLKNKYSNYIYQGRIIKPKAFIKKINELIKSEKLSKMLTGLNSIIIYEPHLKYIDKKVILDTFDSCNFKNIKLINTKDIINKNKIYLEINDNYLIIYTNTKYEFIEFNKYIHLNNIVKKITKKNNKETYLIGINENIPKISLLNNKLFYLENYENYYLDKIIKNKKCNA